ncbi:MAG: hypothetical protein ACRD1R_05135 [Acidobacteriota bacterium]
MRKVAGFFLVTILIAQLGISHVCASAGGEEPVDCAERMVLGSTYSCFIEANTCGNLCDLNRENVPVKPQKSSLDEALKQVAHLLPAFRVDKEPAFAQVFNPADSDIRLPRGESLYVLNTSFLI